MPCIWSSVFLTTISYGLFVNSSKCASDWHWYITDAKISERMKHKDIFFDSHGKYYRFMGSDDNSHSMISSYNQYLSMPPFTRFYDLKTYLKELLSCWPKRHSGDGAGCLNHLALTFHVLNFHNFPMTTYTAVMHRTSTDVPLISIWFPPVDWGQHSIQPLVSKGYV